MKLYKLIGSVALSALVLSSCANHDPFANNLEIGQIVPTAYWELNSSTCKAGGYVHFKGKYYTSSDKQLDRSEVRSVVKRDQSAAATCKLTTSYALTKTVAQQDTVRYDSVYSYPHSKAEWDGYEYVLTDSFPTSRTLSPVTWNEPTEWDQDRFDLYYPSTFQEEFTSTIVTALTKDNTYYNDLRNVYINYDFTAEQIQTLNQKYNLNIPTVTEAGDKSDAWFTTTTVDHYYYITVADSVTTFHEIKTQAEAPEGVSVYPVYQSAEWVFSRYSDDTGGTINSVRDEYMPFWKELISEIPFTGWIYNSSDKNYSVSFSRKYTLVPSFRVYDTTGKAGVASDTKTVELN